MPNHQFNRKLWWLPPATPDDISKFTFCMDNPIGIALFNGLKFSIVQLTHFLRWVDKALEPRP